MDFNLPLGNSADAGACYYWYCDRDISVLDTHHQEDCPYTHPRRTLLRPTKKERLLDTYDREARHASRGFCCKNSGIRM